MGKIIRKLLGLILALLAAYCIWDYPLANISLSLFVLIYAALLYKYKEVWLVIVPALLPVSDMTLYSGRFLLSEFDILLMVTLSLLFIRSPVPPAALRQSFGKIKLAPFALSLMALSFIISTVITLTYPTGGNASDFSVYHNPLNALRVAKGFFWALLFWPFLRMQYDLSPEKTKTYFVSGLMIGLFLAGIGVLWERGVIDGLIHWQGAVPFLTNLLDFSTTYRITGLFAGMHVGGTAIDGYLIMVIPFCLYAYLSHKPTLYQLATTLCLMMGIYGIMVTFSRGLYGGFIIVILLLSVLLISRYLKTPQIDPRKTIGFIIAFIVATLSMVFLFLKGGYGTTVSAIFLILATAFCVSLLRPLPKIILLIAIALIFALAAYGMYDSLSESKWHDNSRAFSATVAFIFGLFFTASTFVITKLQQSAEFSLRHEVKKLALFSLVSSILWLAVIPPLLNTRMEARFSTLGADFAHRIQNWSNALSFREKGFLHSLFGTGVGSFPRYYFFNNYSKEPTVHYRFGQENKVNYLAIGNGDFNLTQKVPVKPQQPYVIRAKVKSTAAKYAITLKLCPKHIIFSERYTPQCITNGFGGKASGQWQQVEREFNSQKLGQSGIFNWPITLMVHNRHESDIVQITNIEIINPQGNNIVSNGDFQQKTDRWVMIRDFSHDAWHAKNIFVHVIFEQGYFGLLAFVLLIACALITQFKSMRTKDPLAPLLIAALCGTLIVGLFGTIIDNPRVATLYFLIIIFGLLNRPTEQTSRIKNGTV